MCVILFLIFNSLSHMWCVSGRRKRRRGSENVDIEDRLESLITRVGEKVTCNIL